jgi:hypothetical protein
MRVDFPEMIELPNDHSETFIRAIENKSNPQVDLVCCIFENFVEFVPNKIIYYI